MAIQSYFDEFKQNYEKPQVDGLIVGFSGIDPQRKSSGDNSYNNSTLSQEQRDIVRQLIREALSVIDFSDCNCDPTQLSDEQKDIIAKLIELKLDEINHCECDNSSLSDEQRSIIRTIIDERLRELNINFDGGNIDDNDEPKPQYEPVDESNLDHEKLKGLLGGDSNGHFHLTQDELLKIASYPAFHDIKHENLPDLMGGCSGQHFHLDSNQFRKLDILIKTFFPDGSDEVIIKPPIPDIPDNPPDEFDPYGGLPSGTPPGWELHMLPNGYEAFDGMSKMYYGDFYRKACPSGLFAHLKKSSSTAIMGTTDLNSWTSVIPENSTAGNIGLCIATKRIIRQYLHVEGSMMKTDYAEALLFISSKKEDYAQKLNYIPYVCTFSKNGNFSNNTLEFTKSINCVAACYSELLQCILFVSRGDRTNTSNFPYMVIKRVKGGTKYTTDNNNIVTVNDGCAAWHPTTAVFCITGKEGTSTSFDGETWTLNKDAPHDLRELSYREDIDNFVAWSGEDKTFYASTDGINWTQLTDTPIPLENISTVHYAPSLKWYCAVGVNAPFVYFSKDLKHWIPTKLRNNSNVDVADVIFMPSTGLYVAMPTSGTYYYTFNPVNWTD